MATRRPGRRAAPHSGQFVPSVFLVTGATRDDEENYIIRDEEVCGCAKRYIDTLYVN